MSLQFRNSFARVAIWRGEKRFSAEDPGPYGPEFFNSITSVSCSTQYARQGDISVVIEPNISDGIKILKTGALGSGTGFGINNVATNPDDKTASKVVSQSLMLEVSFMYPGETLSNGSPAETVKYYGTVQQPTFSLSASAISIELNARGASAFLAQLKKQISIKSDALSAVKTIASDNGVEISVSDKAKEIMETTKIEFNENCFPNDAIKSIIFRYLSTIITFRDDYDLSNGNKRTIFLSTAEENDAKKPKYQFVLYREIDPSNNIIPMYNYSYSGYEFFLNGNAFGVGYKGYDRDSKKEPESDSVIIEEKSTIKPSDKDGTSATFSVYKDNKNSNKPDAINAADGRKTGYIKVSFDIPGIPDVFPDDNVSINILDRVPDLSGLFRVNKVSHKWDGTWITSIDAQNITFSNEPLQAKVEPPKGANSSKSKKVNG